LEFIATPARYPEVIVWGAGQQARYLVNQSSFFKSVRLDHFVDATPAKIGTRYLGVEVRDPSSLRESTQPVIIAAVQGYPLILQQYRQLGLPEERVINDLVI
jgi:FlaA1/EpsC-like NDP-sugar epimerase